VRSIMNNRWIDTYRHWRVGGVRAAWRYLDECDHNHVHVISTGPPVVYLWWGRNDEALHRSLKSEDLLILYLFPWSFPKDEVRELVAAVTSTLARYKRHRICFLCNEEYSVQVLHDAGLEAVFVNQNAFVDERQFRPMPAVTKTHDAVYSASLAPYKRHALARDVASLIMLSYTYGGTSNEDYQREVRTALQHAWWAKDTLEAGAKFSTDQIVELYNRAHVGLCLSAIEGSMFASMEYLLSGLPVVSTRCIGGRDTFWHERTVMVCEDTPESVASAVESLKNRELPPNEVRRLTLAKVEIHRERLREFLRPLGVNPMIPWPQGSHGITSWYSHPKLAREILSGRPVDTLP
jgi:glycosyltransferase involved in cell wall biosynthesis